MATHDPWRWPALAGGAAPQELTYKRGVWGKAHGAQSDFRRIAASPEFGRKNPQLEQQLQLGSEDILQATHCWLSEGNTHYAIACYPSRATDAAGRAGFLEKQIIEWNRSDEVPAVVGALLLLPVAAGYSDAIWWDSRNRAEWRNSDFVLELGPSTCPPAPVGDLGPIVEAGIQALLSMASGQALSEFYAAVLAGQRAVGLAGLQDPLPPAALGALLLPLERAKADKFCCVNALPSQRVDNPEQCQRRWDAVLTAKAPGVALPSPTPTPEQRHRAEQMARALIERNPELLLERPPGQPAGEPTGDADQPVPIQLAIWGPSAAGKTILLGQLLQLETHTEREDWDIYPDNQDSLAFGEQMKEYRLKNSFPPATVAGHKEKISYRFYNSRTKTEASLVVEDRPGRDYELHEEDTRQRLNTADGLVLLVDPFRDKQNLRLELWRLLNYMHLARRNPEQRDERPIAVCISKADFLIESPRDYRRAREEPDAFVRERDQWELTPLLDRFCGNYRLFPLSSVGVRLHYGVIETVVFYDENLRLRLGGAGKSFNLMAPFNWLINQAAAKR